MTGAVPQPRRALLVAALAAVLVRHRAPELVLVHALLDSWRGIGLIVVGMARQSYRLSLTNLTEGEWRAVFASHPPPGTPRVVFARKPRRGGAVGGGRARGWGMIAWLGARG